MSFELTRSFPYKKEHTSPDEIWDRFDALAKIEPRIVNKEYAIRNLEISSYELTFSFDPKGLKKPTLLIVPKDFDQDDLSDYFFEEIRIKVKRYDQKMSVYDWWQQNGWRYSKSKAKFSRERIYELYQEVTTFRPSVMAMMIEYLDLEYVLDFSAGWGDRLIGCLAKGAGYTGIDPNLKIDYTKITDFFKIEDEDVNFIRAPAETVTQLEFMYDAIFTSPPYYDLEDYDQDPSQSIYDEKMAKKSLQDWLEDFLYTTLRQLLKYVQKYLVLIINDPPTGKGYVDQILKELGSWDKLTFLGVISYVKPNLKSPQPMWIYQVN